MDKLWIISLILSTAHKTNGQSNVEVQLKTTNYVERGSSVTLRCLHNVDLDSLYKVAWLRSSEHKFFEYIHRRNPPFRNFSTPGADIDFLQSNASQVTLKNLDFDASAAYFCEVTIDNPIFTKASKEEHIHVIVKQTGPPKIMFKKRLFVVGENLIANCTTTRAKPPPTITWLINGKKVDEAHTKILHPKEYSWGSKHNRSKSHPNNVHTTRDFNDIRGKMYGTVTNTAQDSRDYESSLPNINETEYQYHPFARNGFSYPQQLPRHTHDRSSYRLHQSYGNIITHSGIAGLNNNNHFNFNHNNDKDRDQIIEYENDDEREPNANFYDNKYYDNFKMHRNALSTFHKIRRHLNSENSRASKGSSIKAVMNRPTYSSSQLSIQVSELHADDNGRLEISCISTIPAKISPPLDTFPDFKSYSVKIDVKTTEPSTTHSSPSPTVAALSGSNAPKSFIIWIYLFNLVMCIITTQCLPFSIFKFTFLSM
ncbi:hypothetical protein PVAND_011973 [Polypedilum vanderplanki]|uniref:Ig-like domain-containing protein n=1 Tax=Polypedilum vanderplanki TaxID=319348 RepID=A0A9J6CK69_POLVA|nr:hypothetical protein PVAND_011973 [Polypedilum vanderplanki]